MSAMKWLVRCLVVLLAMCCAVSLTACGSDDDDDDAGGGVVVVTNVVGGTTVVVTNAAPAALVAPQLITPADDTVYSTLLLVDTGYNVNFEWTAVPGAASYVIEVDGVQAAVAGTTTTQELDYGDYEWRVWAKDADGSSGPASGKFSFTIKSSLIIVPQI